MLLRQGRRYGFEFKCTDAPSVTKSSRIALEDLRLEKLYFVYPGKERYIMHPGMEALPLTALPDLRFN